MNEKKTSLVEPNVSDQKTSHTHGRPRKLNRYSTGEDVLRKYSKHRSRRSTGSIEEDLRVEGFCNKNCIITGGSSGLGLETVKMMLLGQISFIAIEVLFHLPNNP